MRLNCKSMFNKYVGNGKGSPSPEERVDKGREARVERQRRRGKIEHVSASSSLYVIHCCARRRRRYCSHVFFRGEREIIPLKGGSPSLSLSLSLSLSPCFSSLFPFSQEALEDGTVDERNPIRRYNLVRYPVLWSSLHFTGPETAKMTPRRKCSSSEKTFSDIL